MFRLQPSQHIGSLAEALGIRSSGLHADQHVPTALTPSKGSLRVRQCRRMIAHGLRGWVSDHHSVGGPVNLPSFSARKPAHEISPWAGKAYFRRGRQPSVQTVASSASACGNSTGCQSRLGNRIIFQPLVSIRASCRHAASPNVAQGVAQAHCMRLTVNFCWPSMVVSTQSVGEGSAGVHVPGVAARRVEPWSVHRDLRRSARVHGDLDARGAQ